MPELSLDGFRPLIGKERFARLESSATSIRALLAGNAMWCVSSTNAGGGVAEMLQSLIGYTRGAGVDSRWAVIEGNQEFFAITKRLHNRIHGVRGDPGLLGEAEALSYATVATANGVALRRRLRRGDIVLLHDPQTAGLAPSLRDAGVTVVWRSHVGTDTANAWTREAWEFLRPHLSACSAFVFSLPSYVPSWIPAERVSIIAPSIDPFSAKNQDLAQGDPALFLNRMGLTSGTADGPATFTRRDGTLGEIGRRASMVATGPMRASDGSLVVQVSRWDRLKDMSGVMTGFASRVVGRVDAQLLLVGPSVHEVADDPEGAAVFTECRAAWESLPLRARRRIRLVTLPMDDVEENDAMVNALQRSATVIVQKSLVEGFGLTVAEGMWKRKPVVASRVGGIVEQVAPGTGILLDDPSDLDAFGDALAALLEHPEEIRSQGENGRRHILRGFISDRHLMQYADLVRRLRHGGPDRGGL